MKYEEFVERGYYGVDYDQLSQWQRFRFLRKRWKNRKNVKDHCIYFVGMWEPTDELRDWYRPKDWWHPKYWEWGITSCQNFERIYLGPACILIAL
jgi:hypothetical protein